LIGKKNLHHGWCNVLKQQGDKQTIRDMGEITFDTYILSCFVNFDWRYTIYGIVEK
jgi:hypothetical protein